MILLRVGHCFINHLNLIMDMLIPVSITPNQKSANVLVVFYVCSPLWTTLVFNPTLVIPSSFQFVDVISKNTLILNRMHNDNNRLTYFDNIWV